MSDTKFFPILPGASLDVAQELRMLRTMIYDLGSKIGTNNGNGGSKLTAPDLEAIRKALQVGGSHPLNVIQLLGGNTTADHTSPLTGVGLSMPDEFTVGNSPITSGAGTILVGKRDEGANSVYAGPDGASGQPEFRGLVVNDIPTLPESKITNLTSDLAGKVPTTLTITTNAPLTGGGDLSANRTLGFGWPSWTDYTPTVTGTGSMTVSGVSVIGAHYIQLGNLVLFEYRLGFTLGGTAAIEVDVSLPVTRSSAFDNAINLIVNPALAGYSLGVASVTSNHVAMFVSGQGNWGLGAWDVIAQGFYQV